MDPDANIPDSELDSLLPSLRPGNRFTTAGEQFLYLGEVGDHEHMIIRNRTIKGPSWNEQPTVLASWYAGLNLDFKERVQPVVIPARDDVPVTVAPNYIEWGGIEGWAPRNLEGPVAQYRKPLPYLWRMCYTFQHRVQEGVEMYHSELGKIV